MALRPIRISGIRTTIAVGAASTAVAAMTICSGPAVSAQAQVQAQAAPSATTTPTPLTTTTSSTTAIPSTTAALPTTATPSTPIDLPTITPSPETFATITPVLSPDRLSAHGALTFTIRYTGGAFGVPAPVRRSVLRFPAGLSLDIPSLRSCSASRLRIRGASGCPAQSQIGSGHALMEVRAGSLTNTEHVSLQAFLGPPHNLAPTFEVLGQGYTPLDERMVFSGSVLPDHAPYGEALVMSVPPIPTLALEPDASISSFSLTIGANGPHRGRSTDSVVIPSRCPSGGFPFAAEFTYADGSTGGAHATAECPR